MPRLILPITILGLTVQLICMNFIVKSIRRFPYLFLSLFFASGVVFEYNFMLGYINLICVAGSLIISLLTFFVYMLLQRRNIKEWDYGDGACQDGMSQDATNEDRACLVSTWGQWVSMSSILLMLVLFFFLGGLSEHLSHPISADELKSCGATETSIKIAEIRSVPKLTKSGKINCEADVYIADEKDCENIFAMLTFDTSVVPFRKGDFIAFSSSLKSTENNEFIGFNYDTYLRKKGVEATAMVKQYRKLLSIMPLEKVFGNFSLESKASELNLDLKNSVKKGDIDADARDLIVAITLGNKTEMDDGLKEAYSKAGASHLLAVSGLHVGIIILIVECLVGMVVNPKKKPYLFAIILLSIIWGYAFLTGLAASVVRTSLMYTVYRVAKLLFSKPSPINVVSFSAFVMLVYNPFNVFDLGFQLSFGAVYSILLFGQPLIKRFEDLIPKFKISQKENKNEDESVGTEHAPSSRVKKPVSSTLSSFVSGLNKLRTYIIGSVAISIAAQILTTPIILLIFHSFPILSIASSLVTIPLVTILIPITFVYYGLMELSMIFPLDAVANGVLYLSILVAKAVNEVVYYTSDISFCTIDRLPFYNYDVVASVTIFLLLAAYFNYRRLSLLWIAASISVSYFTFATIDGFGMKNSRLLAVYDVNGVTAVNRIEDSNTLFCCNDTLKVSKKANEFWTNSLTALPSTSEKTYFGFENKRVYILSDKNEIKMDAKSPLNVDILVLTNNVATKLSELKKFTYKKLIVDGSNKYYVAKKWQDERKKSGVDCHIVRFDGSWVCK